MDTAWSSEVHASESEQSFSEGMAAVKKDGKWSSIDKTGKEIVPYGKYDSIMSFSEGLAAVLINDKMGFIDKSGKEAVPCKYDNTYSFYSFSEGMAVVKLNDKYGFIDTAGKEIVEPVIPGGRLWYT